MVVADHDPALESASSVVVRILEQQRNERLNLQDLGGLFHQDVVILEVELDQVLALQGRVSTRHSNDLGFFDEQVLCPVGAVPDQLKGSELLQLLEDLANVAEAALGHLVVLLEGLLLKQRLRRIAEELGEGKELLQRGYDVHHVSVL